MPIAPGKFIFVMIILVAPFLPAILLPPYYILRVGKRPWTFPLQRLFVATIAYAAIYGIVFARMTGRLPLGPRFDVTVERGIAEALFALPFIGLPAYFLLHMEARPWQFSLRSAFMLTTTYALLLGVVVSWPKWFVAANVLDLLWLACFIPALTAFVAVRRDGWRRALGYLLLALGYVGLVASLGLFAVEVLFRAPNFGSGQVTSAPPEETAILAAAIIVSGVVFYIGFALNRKYRLPVKFIVAGRGGT
jgi:hypothetical protein